MNNINISAANVLGISLPFIVNAMAQKMSKNEYKNAEKNIVAE